VSRADHMKEQSAGEGDAILIGRGGSAATYDLDNGLSVRLEAPEDWGVKQVAFREDIGQTEARRKVQEMEQERDHLRKVHEARHTRQPHFRLTYDCSAFSLAQIARHVVASMRMRHMV